MTKTIYPYKKACLYCGEEYSGSLNSKFCNSAHKALYHSDVNRQKAVTEKERFAPYKSVVDVLIKNCEILDAVQKESDLEQISVSRPDLLNLGFNFAYHTSIDSVEGYNVFMCFDNGLKILGVDTYEVITKRQS